MTADTFSNTLGFLQMQTGNDINTWGVNANNSVFQIFEDAIANTLTSTVTGGTLDLSGSPPPAAASQVRYARLVFNGTLTADQTVKVPNLSKIWMVENATSGAFVLLFQTPSGTATQIPQGSMKVVRCDGANGMRRLDADDIGEAKDYFVTSVPAGVLACDGTAYKRTRYVDLFAKIGTTWGLGTGGDITTFGVPNLTDTGRFKRSSSGSLTVGTYQANQNLAHTHTGTTDATNTDHTHNFSGNTGSESANHTHTQQGTFGLNQQTILPGGAIAIAGTPVAFSFQTATVTISGQTGTESAAHTHAYSGTTGGMNSNASHTHTFTTASSGGSEARPEAAVVLSCIRY